MDVFTANNEGELFKDNKKHPDTENEEQHACTFIILKNGKWPLTRGGSPQRTGLTVTNTCHQKAEARNHKGVPQSTGNRAPSS